ncbi:MAG: phosphoribosylformylglycinamidine cyclo-ligase [Methanopyri archaeon]|nr:phosphoribosylformylglycinamidine cyclo-ligase [Methanopyri archaeon]
MGKPSTYEEAGVDIDAEAAAVEAIRETLAKYGVQPEGVEVLEDIGHYAAVMRVGEDLFTFNIDGVGSKVLVAQLVDRYDTIGIDAIAMNANDAVCLGARPIAFLDYLAVEEPDPEVAAEIAEGLGKGAAEAGAPVVGGELATLPEIIKGEEEGKGFDLVVACLGLVEHGPITGEDIEPGDVLIGLRSSGIHSNGLTLARKVLLSEYDPWDELPHGETVADELLRPTRIYVKPVLEALEGNEVHGIAHITGGGLENLTRLREDVSYVVSDPPEPHPVFEEIRRLADVPLDEMYRTFNMGVGMVLVVPENEAEDVLDTVSKHVEAEVIGRVEEGRGVVVITDEGEVRLGV